MFRLREYGLSTGPDIIIRPEDVTIKLRGVGIDLSAAASSMDDNQSTNAVNVRLDPNGVSTDRATSQLGTAYSSPDDATIVSIFAFQKSATVTTLVRLRDSGWDQYDGTSWSTLTGSFSGTVNDRWSAVVFGNKLIAANGSDKLQSWDGDPTHSVGDLSADAPIAHYLTRIGQRVLAARIHVAGVLDPYLVQWCADGDETDWTDPLAGAGLADLLPEGTSQSAGEITGLSTLAQGGVIYRQRAIMLAQLTGLSEAPFRFVTTKFNHGTESPYSVANGGPIAGDFYLGHDYLVRLFDGIGEPVPIGLPIQNILETSISDLSKVVGVVDFGTMTYWLCIPTDDTGLLRQAWVFSIYNYLNFNRLSWRRRVFEDNITTVNFGPVPTAKDPLVNSVSSIVDTVNRRVNDFANTRAQNRLLFGTNYGAVQYIDEAVPLGNGTFETRAFWNDGFERTLDFVRLVHNTQIAAVIEVSVSVDGGVTWDQPTIYTLPITGRGDGTTIKDFRITGRIFQLRIRTLSGLTTISEIYCVGNNRGRGVS